MSKALLASLFFSFVYGITIVFQSNIVQNNMDPLFLTFISYCFASLLIVLYIIFHKQSLKGINKDGLRWALATSIFASILGDSLVMLGFRESSSVNWGILSRLTLPGTLIFGIILFREKTKFTQIISIILALIGAILVVYKPGDIFALNRGDIYFITAIISYSLANITSQKASSTLSTFELASVRIFFATIIFSLIIPFLSLSHSVNWFFSFYNGAMIVFGTFIVSYIIKVAGANFFSVTSNLIPIFTAAISYFFFHQVISSGQLIGGLLVICSIIIFQLKEFLGKRTV